MNRDGNGRTEDYLEFTRHVDSLASRIRDVTEEDTPFSVGIYGEWGSGKTHFLNLVSERLTEFGIHPVWFNAWKYDQEDNLWAALAQKLVASAPVHGNWRRRLKTKIKLYCDRCDINSGIKELFHWLWGPLKLLFAGGVVCWLTFLWPDAANDKIRTALVNLGFLDAHSTGSSAAIVVRLFVGSIVVLMADVGKIVNLFKKELHFNFSSMRKRWNYRDHISFVDTFSNEFSSIIQAISDSKPIVVIIDDLDRCLPDKAVQVLEAIKLLLDARRCVFVLAMDRNLVERAVCCKYRDLYPHAPTDPSQDQSSSQFGHDYFEKIIHLPLRVPLVHEDTAAGDPHP